MADAGFWNTDQIARLTDRGIRTLVSPDAGNRKTPGLTRQRRKHYLEMREQLATDEGKGLYRQRQSIIEPVFAQTKYNRRIDRFQRRGLWACRAEWRPITATHNLLKLYQHNLAIAPESKMHPAPEPPIPATLRPRRSAPTWPGRLCETALSGEGQVRWRLPPGRERVSA